MESLTESLKSFIEVLSLALTIIGVIGGGGAIALWQWAKQRKERRAEFIHQIIDELRSEEIAEIRYLVEYGFFRYSKGFHGDCSLEPKIDKLLSLLNYTCYLLKSRAISQKDFLVFQNFIVWVLKYQDSVQAYLWNLYHYSIAAQAYPMKSTKASKCPCSFYYLIEWGLTHKMLVTDFKKRDCKYFLDKKLKTLNFCTGCKGCKNGCEPHLEVSQKPQGAPMNAIETRNLTYRYSNTAKLTPAAIEGIDLRVEAGELLAIIGHTGSGKSTLVQHLNALLKPTQGLVLVDGKDIWENKKAIRAARFWVGLCFQYPEYQLFEETVEKDIAFGPKNMGLDAEEIERRVLRALEYVGLPRSSLSKSPFDLSGGERRRAAIAGVMAMEPQALVLDEPTAGLDPMGKEQILAMIKRYREETGRTVILISHNMEEVARMADHVLVMDRGRAAMHGTVEEVFSQGAELAEMGLTVPTVTRIFMRLKEMGMPVGTGVYTMEQGMEELKKL